MSENLMSEINAKRNPSQASLQLATCKIYPCAESARINGQVLLSFFSFGVTVNAEAGMTVHSQR